MVNRLADDPRFQDPGLSMYGSPIEDVKVIQQGCRDMFESRPYAEWEDFFETHPLGKDFVWSREFEFFGACVCALRIECHCRLELRVLAMTN
jgi:hypothetical protein